jgi:hypothetical protein
MQRSAQGKPLDSGLNPKTRHCIYTLPQGVFSETLNYIEGPKVRPELFISGGLLRISLPA